MRRVYWLLLALVCSRWWKLRQTRPQVGALLLGYAILMTVIHTPFVMNTRIRAPVLDPLITVLAGGGWVYRRQSEASGQQSEANELRIACQ